MTITKGRTAARSPWPALLVIMLVLGGVSGGAALLGIRWMQRQASAPVDAGSRTAAGQAPAPRATSTPGTAGSPTGQLRQVRVGQVVRDGGFALKVTKVRLGDTSTVVHLTLKNVGSRPQRLAASIQQVRDGTGNTYQADATYAAAASRLVWANQPPGQAVRGIMVFPVGRAARPAAVELRGAIGSPGIQVLLSDM